MKISVWTGEQIYNEIKKIGEEIDDLGKAMSEIENKNCRISFGILKGLRDEKCKVFNELMKRQYNQITNQ